MEKSSEGSPATTAPCAAPLAQDAVALLPPQLHRLIHAVPRGRCTLLVGPTGSGKTTLLHALRSHWGLPSLPPPFTFLVDRAVVSHPAFGAPENALSSLACAGLGSIPLMLRPFSSLSGGQQSRVNMALVFQESGAALDGFALGVQEQHQRIVAAGASRLIRTRNLQDVIVTCTLTEPLDMISFLQPDTVVFLTGNSSSSAPLVVRNPLHEAHRRPVVALRLELEADGVREERSPTHPRYLQGSEALPEGTYKSTGLPVFFNRGGPPRRTCTVQIDAATTFTSERNDVEFDGRSETVLGSASPLGAGVLATKAYRLGAMGGASGCGKTSHLRDLARKEGCEIAPSAGALGWVRRQQQGGAEAADVVIAPLAATVAAAGGGSEAAAAETAATASEAGSTTALAAVVGVGSLGGARERLRAVGLREAAWALPVSRLSSGEQELAALARALAPADSDAPGSFAAVDEFCSAVDACTAHSAAVGVAAYVRAKKHFRLVVAGVRHAAIRALAPDWHFDAACSRIDIFSSPLSWRPAPPLPPQPPPPTPSLASSASASAASSSPFASWWPRARITGSRIHKCSPWKRVEAMWQLAKPFHYLSGTLAPGAAPLVFTLRLDPALDPMRNLAGFLAVVPHVEGQAAGDPRKVYREHRMVIMPDWQGVALGPRFSEAIGMHICTTMGARFTAVTGNIPLGEQRSNSPLWRPTEKYGPLGWSDPKDNEMANQNSRRRRVYKHSMVEDVEAGAAAAAAARGETGLAAAAAAAAPAAAPPAPVPVLAETAEVAVEGEEMPGSGGGDGGGTPGADLSPAAEATGGSVGKGSSAGAEEAGEPAVGLSASDNDDEAEEEAGGTQPMPEEEWEQGQPMPAAAAADAGVVVEEGEEADDEERGGTQPVSEEADPQWLQRNAEAAVFVAAASASAAAQDAERLLGTCVVGVGAAAAPCSSFAASAASPSGAPADAAAAASAAAGGSGAPQEGSPVGSENSITAAATGGAGGVSPPVGVSPPKELFEEGGAGAGRGIRSGNAAQRGEELGATMPGVKEEEEQPRKRQRGRGRKGSK